MGRDVTIQERLAVCGKLQSEDVVLHLKTESKNIFRAYRKFSCMIRRVDEKCKSKASNFDFGSWVHGKWCVSGRDA